VSCALNINNVILFQLGIQSLADQPWTRAHTHPLTESLAAHTTTHSHTQSLTHSITYTLTRLLFTLYFRISCKVQQISQIFISRHVIVIRAFIICSTHVLCCLSNIFWDYNYRSHATNFKYISYAFSLQGRFQKTNHYLCIRTDDHSAPIKIKVSTQ
jgi:hypothetical protein